MDPTHREHLDRIMSRRRDRGVSVPTPASRPVSEARERPQPLQPTPHGVTTTTSITRNTQSPMPPASPTAVSMRPVMKSLPMDRSRDDDESSVMSGGGFQSNVTRGQLIAPQQLLSMYTQPPPPMPPNLYNQTHRNQNTAASSDVTTNLGTLSQGDWFIKWTAKRDRFHHRFFWLDRTRFMLLWSKTNNASALEARKG